MNPNYAWPKARTEEVVIQDLNQETLVYDKKSHQAHCLNPLASLIWRHCDGKRSWQDLATIAHRMLGTPNDPQVVEMALQELGQAKLLDRAIDVSAEQRQFTRREISKRFSIGAAAAVLLSPLITSVATAAAAAIASPRATTTPSTTSLTTGLPTTVISTTVAICDRNLKENFAVVDVGEVLARLADLPIQTWNYKTDNALVRHVGPMAQDFAAAFHVGADDRQIHVADIAGVAFAAIQGLHQILQRQSCEIDSLRSQLEELRQVGADSSLLASSF